MKTTWWALGLTLLFAPSAMAQTADDLANGAADTGNVLNYGMGYSLQRFSPLTQINKDTVKRLVPVWNYSFDDNKSEQSQPIVYKGVIYVTTGTATMAVDAKTGKQIWKSKIEFPPETMRVACCGLINRGAALYDGKLFRTTLDANVIALDAKTGKELWRANAIDFKNGYSMTVAPIVADGVVITGISGGEFGTRDFIDGWDAQTGQHLWRMYTVPGPGEPGNETWPGESWKHGGAVVTGASQGIGAALVQAFRSRGYRVVANSRSIKAAADPDVVAVPGDIADPRTADLLFEAALKHFGRVDTLVNNAGIFIAKPFTAYTKDDYAIYMATNVTGFFHMTQRAVEIMNKQGRGHVVTITTSLVDQPMTSVPSVLASLTKGALNAATKSLAIECAKNGVRANAVSAGIIKTPMHPVETHQALASLHPMGRMGETSDIVDAVMYLDSAGFVTGEILHVDGEQAAGHHTF